MSDLLVVEKFNLLVIDSRLIASELGLPHNTWMTNVVKKYQTKIEANFGHLHFENGTVTNSAGAVNKILFAWLTEEQSNFLMTLSRNTDQVVEAKIKLVKAFTEAKKLLVKQVPSQPLTQIQMLAAMAQQMAEQEQQLLQQDARIAAIEAEQERLLSPHGHYFTVMGFANLHKLKIAPKDAVTKGRAASQMCRLLGLKVEKIRDARYGEIGMYPEEILVQVFK